MIKLNKKGFTIIELIVVMAVIGILVLLAMPKFMGHTKEAKYIKLISNTKQLENASERYYMDNQDWPRFTDVPYTADQVKLFAQKVYDTTGKEIILDPTGNYYDIDYSKLSQYIQVPDDKMNYIIQNPVGNIYALEALTKEAVTRIVDTRAIGVTLDKITAVININSNVQLIATVLPTSTINKNISWTSNNTSVATVDNTGKVTAIINGIAIITAKTEDGEYVANCSVTINAAFTSQTFSYTGSYQTFTVTTPGNYKLETWGASGGNSVVSGGKGGYSIGNISLSANDVLNIYVGGAGTNLVSNIVGGFNGGGGSSGGSTLNGYASGSGGGGTDFRLNNTSLASRVIVAGGGGGGSNWGSTAGAGGGLIGGTGSGGALSGGYGGTQTTGGHGSIDGTLGQGAGDNTHGNSGGGGGGYYGGGCGGYGNWASNYNGQYGGTGGGGSSYIGTLQNSGTTAGVNTGNGKAIITYVGQ